MEDKDSRKTGYWKWAAYDSYRPESGYWYCSECRESPSQALIPHPLWKYKYCYKCGAKMEANDDEDLRIEKILKGSFECRK